MVLRAMLQLLAICLLDNFFSHFNRRTSLMVRMDNLSAVIVTSRVFPERSNGFHWVYPASSTPSPKGWRNGSDSHGGINRNWVCLLYTSPSPRDGLLSRMPSSA